MSSLVNKHIVTNFQTPQAFGIVEVDPEFDYHTDCGLEDDLVFVIWEKHNCSSWIRRKYIEEISEDQRLIQIEEMLSEQD